MKPVPQADIEINRAAGAGLGRVPGLERIVCPKRSQQSRNLEMYGLRVPGSIESYFGNDVGVQVGR